MKLKKTLRPLMLLCCLVLSHHGIGQNYTIPSQELVDQLLAKINRCKALSSEVEEGIMFMEKNPVGHSLDSYLTEKKVLESYKVCIENTREKLDRLRKDYPEWFNSPSSVIPMGKGHDDIPPSELAAEVAAMETDYLELFERFQDLKKPEK